MDKSTASDLLKMFQGIVLPLELKINSLIEMVRGLENKLDCVQAEQLKAQQIQIASAPVVSAGHVNEPGQCQSERLPTSQSSQQREEASRRVMTRRERARVGKTNDASTAERAVRAEPIAPLEVPAQRTRIAPAPSRQPSSAHAQNAASLTRQYDEADGDNSVAGQWITVTKRKQRPRRLVIRGTGKIDSDLAAVEKTRTLHIWSLRYDTTPDKLQAYMLKKRPSEVPYLIEKLELKHKFYASFIVSVPESAFKFFLNAENWPPNTELNEWFRKRTSY